MPARKISALLAGADEVVLTYLGPGKDKREIRLRDPEWIHRFAAITARARYEEIPPAMWVSDPEISFYRKQETVVSFMPLGSVLRVMRRGDGGDYNVGDETGQAIRYLIRDAEAKQPAASAITARL